MGDKESLPDPESVARGLQRAGVNLNEAKEAGVLAMASGGPDSTFLVWALWKLGVRVVAFHLDHQLRPDSGRDATVASELARRLGIVIDVVKRRPEVKEGRSYEAAARRLRYELAADAAKRHGCSYVATGHTADDRVETFIINVARGAGLDGIKGIPRRNGNIVRPMLDLWKHDVRLMCDREGLWYVEDPSNFDTSILRNRVRLEVLPYLERALARDVKAAIARQLDLLEDDARLLNSHAITRFAEEFRPVGPPGSGGRYQAYVAKSEPFSSWPRAAARRAVRIGSLLVSGSLPRSQWHVERALEAVVSGHKADLGNGVLFGREGKKVVVRRSRLEPPPPATGTLPGTVSAPELGIVVLASVVEIDPTGAASASGPCVAFVNADLAGEIEVRTPRAGERFRPWGLQGSKPLADFLAESGLCQTERAFAPVVAKRGGEVIWVPGHRIAADAAQRSEERRALRLEVRSHDRPGLDVDAVTEALEWWGYAHLDDL